MIQRLPATEMLKPFAKNILSLTFKLLEVDNEENVLVCLRIIIELHKQFRPAHSAEITHFLGFVKNIYNKLPEHLNKIFEPRAAIKVKDLSELTQTFTITTVQTEKKTPDNSSNLSYSLIPKAVLSLKVLQELPIIVVLMYQLYKKQVHMEVAEFIPLIMNTISLVPEVLEYFAGVFALLHPLTFKEVFSQTIDYVVERIFKNYALQIMANSFLANPSPIFATILVEYLLDRMFEMGSNMERSNLYFKLFKLVFGSVSLFAAENEQMLKPHLHQIVNKSMELAMSAKEPYNYFLLLRALFRSIGGGSHDLLYQEFLPLLPNLLQGLNSLQSGLHKQHMKDLFVELCLTVPVRLSSLLPYLPMLMDPLVSALNGSQNLVSQGKTDNSLIINVNRTVQV